MAKETTEQTVGLCREAMTNVRNAYDRGYKQGYKDGKLEVPTSFYNKGLNDAWEIARRITKASGTDEKMNKIFGNDFYYMGSSAFFEKYSIQEVMTKLKEYEEKQKQADEKFKVGDEVVADERRFVILSMDNGGWCNLWCLDNGLTHSNIPSNDLKKTGRSFPQIAEIFKQMKGE